MKYVVGFFAVLMMGCSPEKEKSIVGKWMMHQVVQNGQDVTSEHNPEADRYAIFNADSTFESGGRPYGKNTGTYSINKKGNRIYIFSDAGENDNSQWLFEVHGDTMIWDGFGSEWADGFRLVHVRDQE